MFIGTSEDKMAVTERQCEWENMEAGGYSKTIETYTGCWKMKNPGKSI